MPISIGAKQESDFTDPIGMLGDCHRRIERFLGVLENLASQRAGAALTPADQTKALSTSLRYFREAAPKHTADEEESLFPRLRSAAGKQRASCSSNRIDALEGDHRAAVKGHQEVEALGQTWLGQGVLSPEDASRLTAILRQLAALYAGHIAMEDQEVFPAAAKLLSPSDREAVGAEMAARRGLVQ